MSIKVVLTAFPFFNHVYTPPLQLAYLKAYLLQDKDISVKTIDAEAHFYNSGSIFHNPLYYMEKIRSGTCKRDSEIDAAISEVVDKILTEKPDIVGLSVTNANLELSAFAASQLKQRNPRLFIVFGGLTFSLRQGWSRYIVSLHQGLPDVDCIVKEEGEATLLELVQTLNKSGKATYCAGTTLRVEDKIIDCGERPLLTDIDTIPFPDFSDFDRNCYLSDYIRILFGRGCVGRCNYCTENYTMGVFRGRSAKNILSEIKLRIGQGYRKFQTCDLALNSDFRCFRDVCQLLIDEGINVEFIFSQFRHSVNLTREMFALMYKAGFKIVSFGTESASQEILDRMRKGVKVRTIEQNIRDAYSEGLQVVIFLMVGFPGETEKTFSETVNFLRRNAKYISAVQHVAEVNINLCSGIHDNLDVFNLEKTSLFHTPDRWQTRDGNNNLLWRKELTRRMAKHISDFGINFVDFSKNGNPRISADGLFSDPPRKGIDKYKKNININKDNRGLYPGKKYNADIQVLRNENANGKLIFSLLLTNSGEQTWQRFGSDWIRIGCKIYREESANGDIFTELRQMLPSDIKKGESFPACLFIPVGLLPAGKYRVKFDMLNEYQFWFEELGGKPPVVNISYSYKEFASIDK